jgi:hypothetical protein
LLPVAAWLGKQIWGTINIEAEQRQKFDLAKIPDICRAQGHAKFRETGVEAMHLLSDEALERRAAFTLG